MRFDIFEIFDRHQKNAVFKFYIYIMDIYLYKMHSFDLALKYDVEWS